MTHPSQESEMPEPLTSEEEADLRKRVTALTEGEGITPGPWHAVTEGDEAAYGWWLDNEAGDSSFPSAEDVAVFVNTVPRLLATLDAAREQAATEVRRELLAKDTEARRLLGYLWHATGKNHLRPVNDLFAEDDPIVADVERLAIFPEEPR